MITLVVKGRTERQSHFHFSFPPPNDLQIYCLRGNTLCLFNLLQQYIYLHQFNIPSHLTLFHLDSHKRSPLYQT